MRPELLEVLLSAEHGDDTEVRAAIAVVQPLVRGVLLHPACGGRRAEAAEAAVERLAEALHHRSDGSAA